MPKTVVEAATLDAMDCAQAQPVGEVITRKASLGAVDETFVSDGKEWPHERLGADGYARRWRRMSVCAEEHALDAAALKGVPDDDAGWIIIAKE